MEAHGEQLLQNLVNHEKSLVAKVEEAKREAADAVRDAEQQAEAIVVRARETADADARRQVESSRTEGEAIRIGVLETAQSEAASIAAQAKQNQRAAVSLVVERVLP